MSLAACHFAQAATFTGTVFEDVNYGGGPGRSLADSGGVGIGNVRVELYNVNSGNLVAATTTNNAGFYSLSSGNTGAAMRVRVVNGTVRSTRANGAGCTTCVPVQTFRTNASTGTTAPVTNMVGGETPAASDAISNTTNANYSTLASGGRVPQSITTADPATNNSTINNIDFGFNFSTVVNTRDVANCTPASSSYPCQGSLRQFLINANVLGGKGALVQAGSGQLEGVTTALPTGFESSIFMIPSGALTGGVATITLAGALPAVDGANTRLDATTQTVNIGNTNIGTVGSGGTVGVDAISLPLFQRPEVQLNAGNTTITLDGNGSAILGFALRQGYIRVDGSGCLVRNNLVGMTASGSSADNSPTTYGITFQGANTTVRSNYVTVNNSGIRTDGGGSGSLITLNEVARPTSGHTNTFDGILLVGTISSIQVVANLARDQQGGGIEVGHGGAAATNITVSNNTVRGNGFASAGGGAASSEPIGIDAFNLTGSNVVFSRNLVTGNAGPGILVIQATGVQVTQNSFSSNGGLSIDLDPRTQDPNNLGAPQGVTLNDNGDGDTGPNGFLNYPVIASAVIVGSELSVRGYARPGSAIELYIAQADPSGFGEGLTYLGTLTEGSGADLDATTGSYGPAAINGVLQGTDNTNRFGFRFAIPAGVAIGTALTSTATIGGQTSEFGGNAVVTAGPGLQVTKQVQSLSDPVNNASNPKSIPGSVQRYTVRVSNEGPGAVDNNSVLIVDKIPANTKLFVGNLGAPGSGPVAFVNGTPSSALTWTFTALNNMADDLDFSNDNGATWTYVPTPDGQQCDASVTDIRMRPKGTMPGQGTGSPNFELQFRVVVN